MVETRWCNPPWHSNYCEFPLQFLTLFSKYVGGIGAYFFPCQSPFQFVAGFGKGGTSLPFWENVYGFNMSCVGKELVEDAVRIPIVDVVDDHDLVTSAAVLQVSAVLHHAFVMIGYVLNDIC